MPSLLPLLYLILLTYFMPKWKIKNVFPMAWNV